MRYTITGQYLKTVTRRSNKTKQDYDVMFFLAGWEGDETPQVVQTFPNDDVPVTSVAGLAAFEDVILTLSESSSTDDKGRTFKNYRLHALEPVEQKSPKVSVAKAN